ncbi:MAG: hypothetical protein AAGI70_04520 [Pseudomonadota bacterium]
MTLEQKSQADWSAPVLEEFEMAEVTRGGPFAGRPVCRDFPDVAPCQS